MKYLYKVEKKQQLLLYDSFCVELDSTIKKKFKIKN